MKKEQKRKRKLLVGSEHELLKVKELIDTIFKEAEALPIEVKQALATARDASWKAFVADQEKIMSH